MSIGGINNNGLTPQLKMNVGNTADVKQTQHKSFGAHLAGGLSTAASAVGGAAAMALPNIPGGAVLSAAMSGAQNVGTGSAALTGAGATTGTNPLSAATGSASSATSAIPGASSGLNSQFDQSKQMFEMQAGFNMKFLELQNNMQQESRTFTAVSNMMKNRTDTAKNSLRNIN
ncbi:hypothetical protein L6R29_03770 [Myxococcota bacterium]|nr:hypothetical protein [Myxococcota bacterium]